MATLALAAGQLTWKAFEQLRQAEDRGSSIDAFVDLASRSATQFHGECHVGGDGHVRIKRVILKHHRNVPLFRRHVVDDTVADADFAGSDIFQAGNHSQQGGFAAARRSDQHNEFTVPDRDINAMNDVCGAEGLLNVADRDRSHSLLPDNRGFPRISLCFSASFARPRRPRTPAQDKSSGFRPSKSKPDLRLTNAHYSARPPSTRCGWPVI
jgi:hypothetical protein